MPLGEEPRFHARPRERVRSRRIPRAARARRDQRRRAGMVVVDGKLTRSAPRRAHVGMGARECAFPQRRCGESRQVLPQQPPAHRSCPTRRVTQAEASPVTLGDARTAIGARSTSCSSRRGRDVPVNDGMTVLERAACGTRSPRTPTSGGWRCTSTSRCRRRPRCSTCAVGDETRHIVVRKRAGGDQPELVVSTPASARRPTLSSGYGRREPGVRRHGPRPTTELV